jgi:hypothetical protein
MLAFSQKVFDSPLSGTGTVYTDTRFAELLAQCENVIVLAAYQNSGGTLPTLTVQFEGSMDGTRWLNRVGTPELNALSISSAGWITFTNAIVTGPAMRYVRLRITLGGTAPSTYLRLLADGRSPYYSSV